MKKHMIYNHIPDFCLFGFGFAALAVAWTWPGTVVIASEWWLVGAACIVVAVFIMHATMRALRRAATSTNPLDEPTKLLTTGPFNFSRNPLYLACIYLGGTWLRVGERLMASVAVPSGVLWRAKLAHYSNRRARHPSRL